jgi:nucleotide-binding universal stress UspA family protein
MYKHILVAIGSNLTEAALCAGIARARAFGARLTVVHVVDTMPWWAVVTADCNVSSTLSMIGDHARAVTRHCAQVMEREGIEGTVRTVSLANGMSIGQTIAKTADELDADLIVLGGGARDSDWHFREDHLRNLVCRHTEREVLIAADRNPDARRDGAILRASAVLSEAN